MEYVSNKILRKLIEKKFRFDLKRPLDRLFISNEINKPTISRVLKWLREEKKYYISIGYNGDYSYEIVGIEDGEFVAAEDDYNTHEEAALAGIEYLLDNVI